MPFDAISLETETLLIARYQSGDTRAGNKLVMAYQPLVRSIANRWGGSEDLLAEGNLGLAEALRRFDPAQGARLGTYAAFWVKARIREYATRNRPMASLNEPVGGRSDVEKQDLLVDGRDDQEAVYGDREQRQVRREALRRALDGLGAIDRSVVVARHLRAVPVPLRALAAVYGISGESVRKRELRALAKLGRMARGC